MPTTLRPIATPSPFLFELDPGDVADLRQDHRCLGDFLACIATLASSAGDIRDRLYAVYPEWNSAPKSKAIVNAVLPEDFTTPLLAIFGMAPPKGGITLVASSPHVSFARNTITFRVIPGYDENGINALTLQSIPTLSPAEAYAAIKAL